MFVLQSNMFLDFMCVLVRYFLFLDLSQNQKVNIVSHEIN